jgi:glutathione S-transferase
MPDGFTLHESRAICKFLAAKYDLPYVPPPSDLVARALFDQAEGAELSSFSPSADAISYEKFAKPVMGMPTDEARVGKARRRLEGHFDVLEGILGGQKFMAGKEFSLVDICYVSMVDRLEKCGEEGLVRERKNVSAWRERCLGRPPVKKFLDGLLTLEDIKRRLAAVKS